MELGMIGLGKMGLNLALNLTEGGHRVLGYDPGNVSTSQFETKQSLEEVVDGLKAPRVVWVMVPPPESRGQYLAADTLQNTIGKFLAPVTVLASGFVSSLSVFTLILLSALIGMGLYAKLFHQLAQQDG